MTYPYKTAPYEHQREALRRSAKRPAFAYLMEMGTGKTKVTLDNAAYLWSAGEIEFLLIAAPNGVHRNWTRREIPTHLPEWTNYRAASWSSTMLAKEEREVDKVLRSTDPGLRVLCVNLEAFGVPKKSYDKKAGKIVRHVLENHRTMFVVDESSMIKSPGSNRTRRLMTLSRHAPYRRILTGTAITNSPLDAYAQFKWLDPRILGMTNFQTFKSHYGVWKTEVIRGGPRKGETYPVLVRYQNLDELSERIHNHSYRVLKRDCLDLPPKIYTTREVTMAEKQKKLYRRVRDESLIEINGVDRSVGNILEKMVRLQQILGGFMPKDYDDDPDQPIFEKPEDNPKIKEVLRIAEETSGQVIIFANFQAEIRALGKVLGNQAVLYYGPTSRNDREEAIDRFQRGDVWFFIGSRSAAYGLTLTAAETVIYYSNSYRLDDRLQSEDRAHRAGLTHPVTYVDLVFPGTADTKAIHALKTKKDVADLINRDQPSEWL